MPYIKQEDRELFDDGLEALAPSTVGDLNYCVTKLTHKFLRDTAVRRCGKNKPNYAEYNAAIGALECAKIELYRRMIAPYEDTKIKENGDV